MFRRILFAQLKLENSTYEPTFEPCQFAKSNYIKVNGRERII